MKKITLVLLLFVSTFLSATTLTGVVKNSNNTTVLAGGSVTFDVVGCTTTPMVGGSPATTHYSFTLDGSGNLTGTVSGTDVITCTGTPEYLVKASSSSAVLQWQRYYLITGSTWNVSTATPTSGPSTSGGGGGSTGPLSGAVIGTGSVTPGKIDVLDASGFCADAGSSDSYACNLSPPITSYVPGTRYRFKANTANIGTASINFNAVGAKTIKKAVGGITTNLADNDIRAGQWVDVVYDGTNMQMQSTLGNAAAAGNGETGWVSASTPAFSPVAGTYSGTQSVNATCSVGTVFCLTVGVTPGTATPADVLSSCSALSVVSSTTLYASCRATSLTTNTASAAYVITGGGGGGFTLQLNGVSLGSAPLTLQVNGSSMGTITAMTVNGA